jgi:hypothetical protein
MKVMVTTLNRATDSIPYVLYLGDYDTLKGHLNRNVMTRFEMVDDHALVTLNELNGSEPLLIGFPTTEEDTFCHGSGPVMIDVVKDNFNPIYLGQKDQLIHHINQEAVSAWDSDGNQTYYYVYCQGDDPLVVT